MVQVYTGEAPADTSLPPRPAPHFGPEMDRLVRAMAGRLHARLPRGCGIEFSDLVQAGNLGLLQAAWSYDPSRGAPLAGFARFRIRGEMIDMVRRQAGRGRTAPALVTDGDDWEARIPAGEASSPQDSLLKRQRAQIIGEEVGRLPARQRTVMRLRYSGEMTLHQIGTALQVNESRACQIHRSALQRLKRALSSRGVRGFGQL